MIDLGLNLDYFDGSEEKLAQFHIKEIIPVFNAIDAKIEKEKLALKKNCLTKKEISKIQIKVCEDVKNEITKKYKKHQYQNRPKSLPKYLFAHDENKPKFRCHIYELIKIIKRKNKELDRISLLFYKKDFNDSREKLICFFKEKISPLLENFDEEIKSIKFQDVLIKEKCLKLRINIEQIYKSQKKKKKSDPDQQDYLLKNKQNSGHSEVPTSQNSQIDSQNLSSSENNLKISFSSIPKFNLHAFRNSSEWAFNEFLNKVLLKSNKLSLKNIKTKYYENKPPSHKKSKKYFGLNLYAKKKAYTGYRAKFKLSASCHYDKTFRFNEYGGDENTLEECKRFVLDHVTEYKSEHPNMKIPAKVGADGFYYKDRCKTFFKKNTVKKFLNDKQRKYMLASTSRKGNHLSNGILVKYPGYPSKSFLFAKHNDSMEETLQAAIQFKIKQENEELKKYCDEQGLDINQVVNLNDEAICVKEDEENTEDSSIVDDNDEVTDELTSISSAHQINNTVFYPSNELLTNNKEILVISLFGGIGLLEYPLRYVNKNYRIILYVEKNKNAQKIFFRNFNRDNQNHIRLIEDINHLDPDEIATWVSLKYPYHDLVLINAGFPCKTFSKAGKRTGLTDRSTYNLFEKVVNLLRALQRKKQVIFLMENVAGLAKFKFNKPSFEIIKKELSCNGLFKISYITLNSLHFNLPQSRDRLFLFATTLPFPIIIKDKKKCKNFASLESIIDFKDKNAYKAYPLHAVTQEALKNYTKLKKGGKVLVKTSGTRKVTAYLFKLRPPIIGNANNLACNNKGGTKRYSGQYSSFHPRNPSLTLSYRMAPYFSFYTEGADKQSAYGRKFTPIEIGLIQGLKEDFNLCEDLLKRSTIIRKLANAVACPVVEHVFTCMMSCLQSLNPYYSISNSSVFFQYAPSKNNNNHYAGKKRKLCYNEKAVKKQKSCNDNLNFFNLDKKSKNNSSNKQPIEPHSTNLLVK